MSAGVTLAARRAAAGTILARLQILTAPDPDAHPLAPLGRELVRATRAHDHSEVGIAFARAALAARRAGRLDLEQELGQYVGTI